MGQGATAPSAENVTTIPVSPSEVVPTVKPASQVGPTDAVIDPNAPASSGATTGSPLHANDDDDHHHDDQSGWISDHSKRRSTGSVSCSAGNHDQRTFGSVLQDHMNRVARLRPAQCAESAENADLALGHSDLLALLSNLFGSFTLDFSAWSGLLTALRSLIIALAAFVAYRIIFVGNA